MIGIDLQHQVETIVGLIQLIELHVGLPLLQQEFRLLGIQLQGSLVRPQGFLALIDFTQERLRQRIAAGDALAPAGEKSYCGLKREAFRATLAEAAEIRLMPIFLTTATTVAGLFSLMFGGGPLFKGLATAFASGLIVGSAITLFVLPALIALFVENFGFALVSPEEVEGDRQRSR